VDQSTEFLRVKELPDLTRLSRATWDRLVARRAIPVVRIGRAVLVRRVDLDRFLNERRESA
jgi:excisionase family DNA binding protein